MLSCNCGFAGPLGGWLEDAYAFGFDIGQAIVGAEQPTAQALAPGAEPIAYAGAPSAAPTTTSSAMLTADIQVSPQISPVFTQVQDSPGTVTAVTTTQAVPAAGSPYYGTPDLFGPSMPQMPRDAGAMLADIQQSRPFNWTPVIWVGGLAIAGIIAIRLMKKG